jgi:hypothetical protein
MSGARRQHLQYLSIATGTNHTQLIRNVGVERNEQIVIMNESNVDCSYVYFSPKKSYQFEKAKENDEGIRVH